MTLMQTILRGFEMKPKEILKKVPFQRTAWKRAIIDVI